MPTSKKIAWVAALLSVVALIGAVTLSSKGKPAQPGYIPADAGSLDGWTSLPQPVDKMSKAPATPDPFGPKVIPVPVDQRHLTLGILSSEVGAIPTVPAKAPANVGVIDAPSNEMVEPPHGPDKKGADWNDTTVRVRESVYPSYPSYGTTYIYGHSCVGAICPFSAIQPSKNGGYTVKPKDLLIVTTPTGQLTYAVTQVGAAAKRQNGPLPDWASDSSVPNRVVLVTCEFDENGNSNDNIIIAADLLWTKPLV